VPHYAIINMIQEGQFGGQQVDWGAGVARAAGARIQEFIHNSYGDPDAYVAEHEKSELEFDQRHAAVMRELIRVVNQLDPNKQYALVAVEL
jgi:hypothetical protein